MRLVLLSDTHNQHADLPPIPDGDLLVHAGDLTCRGTLPELCSALHFLAALPHRHKIVIAGNHDRLFETDPGLARSLIPAGVTYLEDAGTVVEGVRIWGSPWQPAFMDWAYNLRTRDALAARWARIPDDTQLLITHGPPYGLLDRVHDPRQHVGCPDLRERVRALPDLRLHVFGHIHDAAGRLTMQGVTYANASITIDEDTGIRPPLVIDLAF